MDTAGDPGDPSDTDTTIPKTLIGVDPDETGAVETQNYGENVSSTHSDSVTVDTHMISGSRRSDAYCVLDNFT